MVKSSTDGLVVLSDGFGEIKENYRSISNQLQLIKERLYTEDSGSLCMLASYKTELGVVLVNEYDECYASDCSLSMSEMLSRIADLAEDISNSDIFSQTQIMVERGEDCHRLIVFVPGTVSKESFVKVTNYLFKNAYRMEVYND